MSNNVENIFKCIGASNHCKDEREENDFYATEPKAIDCLFEVEKFARDIWEPAAGMGHLSKRMVELKHSVISTDLIDRGYSDCTPGIDFLQQNLHWRGDIITNPPYSIALEFIEKALSMVDNGAKVGMLLKLSFLEGIKRKKFYEDNPPKMVYAFSKRIQIAKGGDFEMFGKSGGNAIAFAWFVWEKGFQGKPGLGWVN